MAGATTYKGGCHCGKVRYEVSTEIKELIECNCSICSKRGFLWTFTSPTQFKLLSGQDAMPDYQFGKQRIHHLFCPTCGVQAFARGTAPSGQEMVAVNVRCLDGIDVTKLPIKKFDGASL
jgi:hypothetical protein